LGPKRDGSRVHLIGGKLRALYDDAHFSDPKGIKRQLLAMDQNRFDK